MLVFTLWSGVIALVTTTGIVLFGSKKRRSKTAAWLKKVRHRRWEATKTEGKRSWRAHKVRRAATPRGMLREQRRKQPRRLSVGRVRTADDPTVARKVARKTKVGAGTLWQKAKVAHANRKAGKKPAAKKILELLPGTDPGGDKVYSHLCGAPIDAARAGLGKDYKARCSRVVATPGQRCWQHGGKRAA